MLSWKTIKSIKLSISFANKYMVNNFYVINSNKFENH